MVTLIVLVGLSVAGGFLVLALLENDETSPPATRQGGEKSLRASSAPDTSPLPDDAPPDENGSDPPVVPDDRAADPGDAGAAVAARTPVTVATDTGRRLLLERPPAGPPYGDARDIPSPYVAVEGPFSEVAQHPWWRRLLSLAAVAGIVVVLAIVFAALLGGAIGALGELLDGAIE